MTPIDFNGVIREAFEKASHGKSLSEKRRLYSLVRSAYQ